MKDNQNLPVPSDYNNNGPKSKRGLTGFTCWIPIETNKGFRQYCRDRGLLLHWVMGRVVDAVVRGELDDLIYTPSAFKKPSTADYYELKKATRRLP
ncbi:MAG: hypothetical protein A2W19_07330 [Spirochaetes bacterium RBG_16_49_21]|nr:MAG: hypothetical protein A2W19_07330 [Spirochaetes bacterium RBG_16_49_21]